jgi:hypothetical protein
MIFSDTLGHFYGLHSACPSELSLSSLNDVYMNVHEWRMEHGLYKNRVARRENRSMGYGRHNCGWAFQERLRALAGIATVHLDLHHSHLISSPI